jgi:uncharacterized protein YdeI (YjbR/CyaY-like superfamily)
MKTDTEILSFTDRGAYREWLAKNRSRECGVWIVFEKGSKRFTANDALEESICFGWIDGVMKSMDEKTYRKYFSRRKNTAKWSDKNKAIYADLTKRGLMTDSGMEVYKPVDGPAFGSTAGSVTGATTGATTDSAVKPAVKTVADMSEKILTLKEALHDDKDALRLFDAKPPSKQKQFAGFYCDAKTDVTRAKRKDKIVGALRDNYGGMLY